MAIPQLIHQQVMNLEFALREHLPFFEFPGSPGEEALIREYSLWFTSLNYLLQISEQPTRPMPAAALDVARELRNSFQESFEVPIPPIPQGLSFNAFGSWLLTLGAATSGDVWCEHGSKRIAMNVRRNQNQLTNIQMECKYAHGTTFDKAVGQADVKVTTY